jgi:hypothetical protein
MTKFKQTNDFSNIQIGDKVIVESIGAGGVRHIHEVVSISAKRFKVIIGSSTQYFQKDGGKEVGAGNDRYSSFHTSYAVGIVVPEPKPIVPEITSEPMMLVQVYDIQKMMWITKMIESTIRLVLGDVHFDVLVDHHHRLHITSSDLMTIIPTSSNGINLKVEK